jgi:hypothetical protein
VSEIIETDGRSDRRCYIMESPASNAPASGVPISKRIITTKQRNRNINA